MEIINLIFSFSQEGESKWVGSFPQITVLTTGTFVSPFSQGPPQIKKNKSFPKPFHPPICPNQGNPCDLRPREFKLTSQSLTAGQEERQDQARLFLQPFRVVTMRGISNSMGNLQSCQEKPQLFLLRKKYAVPADLNPRTIREFTLTENVLRTSKIQRLCKRSSFQTLVRNKGSWNGGIKPVFSFF